MSADVRVSPALAFMDYGDDRDVTYADADRRLGQALGPFKDNVKVAWVFGGDFALEHVIVTIWAEDGNNSVDVTIIPYIASVQLKAWVDSESDGIPTHIISAAKSVAETVSMDVTKALEVFQNDYKVEYFEPGVESMIPADSAQRLHRARRDSAGFLHRLVPSAVAAHNIGDSEVAAIRTVALTLLGELVTIDPEDLEAHLDDGQRAAVAGFWRMLTPAVPDPHKSIAAFDALKRFRVARQEVSA